MCHPLVGFDLTDLLDAHSQVVDLEHLDVPAEVGGHKREVGGHVEHARVEMAQQAVPAVPQLGAYPSGLDPAADLVPGGGLFEITRNAARLDSAAAESVDHFRLRAGSAVGETG